MASPTLYAVEVVHARKRSLEGVFSRPRDAVSRAHAALRSALRIRVAEPPLYAVVTTWSGGECLNIYKRLNAEDLPAEKEE